MLNALIFASLVFVNGPERTVRQQIEQAYTGITSAFIAKDFPRFKSYMTPDFKGSAKGSPPAGRDAAVADFKAMRQRLSEITWVKKIIEFKAEGNTVVSKIDGSMKGYMSIPSKKPAKFELKASAEDHWLRTPQGWKLTSSEKQHIRLFINGVPLRDQH